MIEALDNVEVEEAQRGCSGAPARATKRARIAISKDITGVNVLVPREAIYRISIKFILSWAGNCPKRAVVLVGFAARWCSQLAGGIR